MARPRKTSKHHKSTGNFRPSRHGTLALPVEIPVQPPDLGLVGQATWNVITKHLYRSGLIAAVDQTAIRLLCDSMEDYIEAVDDVRESGRWILEEMGDGRQKRVINPAFRVKTQAHKEIKQLLQQFGMTPASRTGIRPGEAGGENTEEDRVSDILGFNVVG